MNLRFWQPRKEKRSSLSQPTDWLINTLQNVFGYQTKSGQAVNDRTALSIASVHACVRVIADGIAGLSLKLYKDDGTNREQVVVHYATALVNETIVPARYIEMDSAPLPVRNLAHGATLSEFMYNLYPKITVFISK